MANLNIHIRLRTARKKLNLNQTQIAEDLNIQQKSVSDIENGKTTNIPNSYIYYFYSKGISLEWIFDDKGSMLINDNLINDSQLFEPNFAENTDINGQKSKEHLKSEYETTEKTDIDNIEEKDFDYDNKMYERIIAAKDETIKNLHLHIKLQENNIEFLQELTLKMINKK